MAAQDDWPEESGPRDPWESREAPRPGMSTGTKVLIVVLSIGGLVVLLCCGGVFWLWSQADFEVQETPKAAVETTEEIAEIRIPPEFKPKAAMRMRLAGVGMVMAMYELEDGQGSLMIGEMQGLPPGEAQPERQMREALEGQDGQRELTVNRTEAREFEIRGETVRFQFSEGVDDQGNEYRMVEGMFPTEDGQGILVLQVPAEAWDEEAVVEMIESIQ